MREAGSEGAREQGIRASADAARAARQMYRIHDCEGCGATMQGPGIFCPLCQGIDERVERSLPPAPHKCEIEGCRNFTINPKYCDDCALEIAALERVIDYFPAAPGSELCERREEREKRDRREMKELRAAFRRADWRERGKRANEWVKGKLWIPALAFVFGVLFYLGFSFGAAVIDWLRGGAGQ